MQNREIALITGASGTIGSSIANLLAQEGYSLILHYHHNREVVEKISEKYSGEGRRIVLIQEDLSSFEGVKQLFITIEENQLNPSVLINALGIASYGLIQDVSLKNFEYLINVNVMSYFFCAQLAIPFMIKNKFGRIINISSIWGEQGAANEVAYSMTKGAVNTFTKALAKELAPSGVTVNAIAPGIVYSKMMSSFSQGELEELKASIPLQRFLDGSEIAHQVLHLLKDYSSYITGQIITMDGGWS